MFLATQFSAAAVPSKDTFIQVRVKPRRALEPSKPGKTAKMKDRRFVQHNYHDHALDRDMEVHPEETGTLRRGGNAVTFPVKLHAMLDHVENIGLAHVISWQPHGRCFVIHKPKEFSDWVLPYYFMQRKITSFQRQLSLYGFKRLTQGNDAHGYYHELFLRGRTFLCKRMARTTVKGTGYKPASSPDQEPDFWRMPPVYPITITPNCGDDGSSMPQNVPLLTIPSFSPVHHPAIPASFVVYRQEKPVPQDMLFEPLPLNTEFSSDSDSGVLDEVIDDLLHHTAPEETANILDFINTWHPEDSFSAEEMVGEQLGLLL